MATSWGWSSTQSAQVKEDNLAFPTNVFAVESQEDRADADLEEDKLPRWRRRPEKFGHILNFLSLVSSKDDVFQRFGVEECLEMFILCSHSTKRSEVWQENRGQFPFHC